MQVSKTITPQLLSNYEVYAHLSAQKKLLDPLIAAQQSQLKRRRFKADSTLYDEQTDKEKARRMPMFMPPRDLDPDLGELSPEQEKQERLDEVRGTTVTGGVVMVQDAVLKYLSQPEHPTLRQTPQGIENVLGELAVGPLELTKAEMYMICNLCPTTQVALYCIVEEIEARCQPEQMDQVTQLVESSLTAPAEQLDLDRGDDSYDGADDEEMQMQEMEEEFVHEAEWGADKEVGVEDDKDGDMD